jgi:hypothetical protein
MKRGKKREIFYFRLDKDIYEKFNEHISSVGYDKPKLIAKILENFLKNNDK